MTPEIRKFLEAARVAHMATVDGHGRPTNTPLRFQVHKNHIFAIEEEKPRRADDRRLQRMRNVAANPYAAIVVDRWDEDWRWLAGVHMRGKVRVEEPGELQEFALALLRAKYPQYREMELEEKSIIVFDAETIRTWGSLG